MLFLAGVSCVILRVGYKKWQGISEDNILVNAFLEMIIFSRFRKK